MIEYVQSYRIKEDWMKVGQKVRSSNVTGTITSFYSEEFNDETLVWEIEILIDSSCKKLFFNPNIIEPIK